MNSSNPALKNILSHTVPSETSKVMTLNGTVNKTGILLLCSFMTALFTWSAGPGDAMPYMFTGLIGGFIVSLATIFKPSWSAFTAPVYALLEGLFLGVFQGSLMRCCRASTEPFCQYTILKIFGGSPFFMLLFSHTHY
jgi:uncharacterized YccA/Bax inhibitor family protein